MAFLATALSVRSGHLRGLTGLVPGASACVRCFHTSLVLGRASKSDKPSSPAEEAPSAAAAASDNAVQLAIQNIEKDRKKRVPYVPIPTHLLAKSKNRKPLTPRSLMLPYQQLAKARQEPQPVQPPAIFRHKMGPVEGQPPEVAFELERRTFAVVDVGGQQFKVTKDDLIMTEKVDADVGEQLDLDMVRLIGARDFTIIGKPSIEGARVVATVEEHTKTEKLINFYFRRRKHSKRTRGVRPTVSILRINDIVHSVPVTP